ncbi:hypothetical protein B0T10DRAFT_162992 [Thelonectria olida]|uniref:Zn(2)-C6 fungal-type domain-containing protein n=1 Tax=Thelonectria olida TaxID=1576542 RepID=A0A9P8WFV1_9HYPO|nr:hypothetical protein B0T10DRAFT_162992 [Thelonectria olida]
MSTASLAPEKPLRFACNRCHSLKLRCPRSNELDKSGPDEPCSRCRKAGAACIVSERGKVGRPAKRKATPPTPAELVEVSTRHEHHRGLRKSSSAGLIHVFGLVDPALQTNELTPPESLDHSLHCDAENLLSGAVSPVLTPLQQQSSRESEADDHNKAAWHTHHPWAGGHLDTDPNNFPGPEAALYEPFPQDIDLDIDLPTFQFPQDTAMFDLGGIPGLKNKDEDHLFTSMFENTPASKKATQKKLPPPPSVSVSDWSSTSCLLKLSDLSARMLRSSENRRASAPAANSTSSQDPPSSGCNIVKETVDFSGELIDVARQTLPRVFAFSNRRDSALGTEASTPTGEGDDDGTVHSAASSVHDWANVEAQSAPTMPESAVIFLLLGCYTQLLYSFELAIDCLYAEHKASERSANVTIGGGLGNINSMLKASLSIQTVIYLLDRVHRAFMIGESDARDGDGMQDDESNSGGIEGWKRSLMGAKSIDEGLLGRTFDEIQEREQRLMKKAQQLKQMINRLQI